jgi:SAM-dependent methyltransferase
VSRFDLYAAYYDLLYGSKDYSAEADHVLGLLPTGTRALLELGCGSHALALARRGLVVDGVDLSPAMVARAAQRGHRLYLLGGPPGGWEQAADVENCNFVANAGAGINLAGAHLPGSVITVCNCGHFANSAGFLGGADAASEQATVAYTATPYVYVQTAGAPRAGDFTLAGEARGAGRLALPQSPDTYSPATTDAKCDLGAMQASRSPGGLSLARIIGEL